VKVRIGVALPGRTQDLPELLDACEHKGVDSVWFSERPATPLVDPVVGMAYAAARTRRLKLGTGVTVLPGRNPVVLAKQLASLAALAPGRILPAFGLQAATPAERQAFPTPPGQVGAVFDEALVVLRRLLSEDEVSHHGEFFTLEQARVEPRPVKPLDLWLGGSGPRALERIGRYADGWLAAFLVPGQTAAGKRSIETAADAAGRHVDDDHYGASLVVALDDAPPEQLLAAIRARNPDADPAELVPRGWPALRDLVSRHIDGGISKFVVRPAGATGDWPAFLDQLTDELRPLQS
jgi:probable F420-dependent oxidoreductase